MGILYSGKYTLFLHAFITYKLIERIYHFSQICSLLLDYMHLKYLDFKLQNA
jgi:hypothetical protein